VARFSGR